MMGIGGSSAEDGAVRFFVDRITGGVATLICDGPADGEITLPQRLLPAGTSEGCYLRAFFEIDAEAGDAARREIDALLGELGDNP
jgi:hypothetical protein